MKPAAATRRPQHHNPHQPNRKARRMSDREWFWTRIGMGFAFALVTAGAVIKILIAAGVIR